MIKLPQVVILDSNQTQVMGALDTDAMQESSSYRSLFANLRQFEKSKESSFKQPKIMQWKLNDGKSHHKGEFVSCTEGRLTILQEGTQRTYPLEAFNAGTVAYAKRLQSMKERKELDNSKDKPENSPKKKEGPMAELKAENWTNSKGQTVKATFVKLDGEKITLRLANGKESTFNLNVLSTESIARAKELAAVKDKK